MPLVPFDVEEGLTLAGNAHYHLDLFKACYQQIAVELGSYTAEVDYFMSMVFTPDYLLGFDDDNG